MAGRIFGNRNPLLLRISEKSTNKKREMPRESLAQKRESQDSIESWLFTSSTDLPPSTGLALRFVRPALRFVWVRYFLGRRCRWRSRRELHLQRVRRGWRRWRSGRHNLEAADADKRRRLAFIRDGDRHFAQAEARSRALEIRGSGVIRAALRDDYTGILRIGNGHRERPGRQRKRRAFQQFAEQQIDTNGIRGHELVYDHWRDWRCAHCFSLLTFQVSLPPKEYEKMPLMSTAFFAIVSTAAASLEVSFRRHFLGLCGLACSGNWCRCGSRCNRWKESRFDRLHFVDDCGCFVLNAGQRLRIFDVRCAQERPYIRFKAGRRRGQQRGWCASLRRRALLHDGRNGSVPGLNLADDGRNSRRGCRPSHQSADRCHCGTDQPDRALRFLLHGGTAECFFHFLPHFLK